jgi:hypothetical protein
VKPKAIVTKGNLPMNYFRKFAGRKCEYETAYEINIEGFRTTLLPLNWTALNGRAREPHKRWVLDRISELDSEAAKPGQERRK